MEEREFNLIEEPWVRVLKKDRSNAEVSLLDVFAHAHEYLGLSGETPQQNAAMIRFLLAIVHSVFARDFEDTDEAIKTWKDLWESAYFPMDQIREYLETYHDRFWLFDTQFPFYQIPESECANGTALTASGLNGAIAQSGNTIRQFAQRHGKDAERLSYAEAARWLVFRQAYDDTAGKKKKSAAGEPKQQPDKKSKEKKVSSSVGWLGNIGLIMVEGKSLFETLLLNACFLRDGRKALWRPVSKQVGDCAVWELDQVRTEERCVLPMPGNPAGLYTIQARRIALERKAGFVTGYRKIAGDKFLAENAINEQMTLWHWCQTKGKAPCYKPTQHDPAKAFWREFPLLCQWKKDNTQDNTRKIPGLICWLKACGITNQNLPLRIRMIALSYDPNLASFQDIWTDSLWINAGVLGEVGQVWQEWIEFEVEKCEMVANAIKLLALRLAKAAGDRPREKAAKKKDLYTLAAEDRAKALFLAEIDPVFRRWLAGINPVTSKEEYIFDLRNEVRSIALRLGDELVKKAGDTAFCGRMITENDAVNFYASPKAIALFKAKMSKIYEAEKAEKTEKEETEE